MASSWSGYSYTGVELGNLELFGRRVVVEEEWDRPDTPAGLFLAKPGNTTIGTIVAVGSAVDEDITVGDRILFETWQGGRWSFRRNGEELHTLVIDEQFILARLEENGE